MGTKTTLRTLWVLVTLAGIGVMTYAGIEMAETGAKAYVISWWASGLFVILTIPISLFGIFLHLNNYNDPIAQRYVIRIMWMVPVYAMDAWLALRFKEMAIYLDIGRECYEAYVIYSFTFFLIHIVGRDKAENWDDFEKTTQACGEIMKAKEQQQKHLFPFCLLRDWPMGIEFVRNCKFGVLFYCVCKITTALATFFMELGGVYGNGQFNFERGYVYCTILNNFAQLWALYCLVLFYHACHAELKPIRPLGKFLCIKSVVFFSFWQGVAVSIAAFAGWIDEQMAAWVGFTRDDRGVENFGTGLQDFLICIEMFVAAIAHVYCFSHEDFKRDTKPNMTMCQKIRAIFDVDDVRADVYDHLKGVGQDVVKLPKKVGQKVKNTVKRARKKGDPNEALLESPTDPTDPTADSEGEEVPESAAA